VDRKVKGQNYERPTVNEKDRKARYGKPRYENTEPEAKQASGLFVVAPDRLPAEIRIRFCRHPGSALLADEGSRFFS
jgi:hypothetical protein